MIVVLPGITGSVLVDERGRDIWAPSGGALWSYVSSLGDSMDKLRVASHAIGGDAPTGGLRATRLAPDFHGVFGLGKIDGYTRLTSMLKESFELTPAVDGNPAPANFIEFPYDWRLSNRTSARALATLIDDRLPAWRKTDQGGSKAKVILVAHSMGGLVSRYYLEVLGGWRNCRALITFGTPYRGSVDSLGYLANGYKKALMDLTEALRTMPSVYELLPLWPVISDGGVFRRVTEVSAIAHVDRKRALDARKFHDEIENAVNENTKNADYLKDRYQIFPVVGFDQPTLQSASFDGTELRCLTDRAEAVPVELQGGDGTVPRVSATPLEMSNEYREQFFAEKHGSLQNNSFALDDLRERLRQMQAPGLEKIRGALREVDRLTIGIGVEDLYLPNEPVRVTATLNGRQTRATTLVAELKRRDDGARLPDSPFREGPNGFEVTFDGLAPGSYRLRVASKTRGASSPMPVSDVFEVAATV
jgi:pimeloyl-ACP methyl ester carboxylesterase